MNTKNKIQIEYLQNYEMFLFELLTKNILNFIRSRIQLSTGYELLVYMFLLFMCFFNGPGKIQWILKFNNLICTLFLKSQISFISFFFNKLRIEKMRISTSDFELPTVQSYKRP